MIRNQRSKAFIRRSQGFTIGQRKWLGKKRSQENGYVDSSSIKSADYLFPRFITRTM